MRPVILLHGWGGSFASTWVRHGWVAAFQASGREVPPLDLPGHGGLASHQPADYGDLAATIATRLPTGEQCDIVGYSLGAKLALALAAREPDRFANIVIGGVGDNIFAPEAQGEALATALENGQPAGAAPAVAALIRYAQASGHDPLALAAVLRRSPNPVFDEQAFANISRILMVNGDTDAIACPDARLRAALGKPEYRSLPGVDHLALPADPEFLRLAIDFTNAE